MSVDFAHYGSGPEQLLYQGPTVSSGLGPVSTQPTYYGDPTAASSGAPGTYPTGGNDPTLGLGLSGLKLGANFLPRWLGGLGETGEQAASGLGLGVDGSGASSGFNFGDLSNFNPANIAGGVAASFTGQPAHNAGGQIGQALGGIAGSFIPIPFLGTALGSLAGRFIGGQFGPNKTVGPGQTYGYDYRTGAPSGLSSDNGGDPSLLQGASDNVRGILERMAQQYGATNNLDQFQVGWQPQQGGPQIALYNRGNTTPYVSPMSNPFDLPEAALTGDALSFTDPAHKQSAVEDVFGAHHKYDADVWAATPKTDYTQYLHDFSGQLPGGA